MTWPLQQLPHTHQPLHSLPTHPPRPPQSLAPLPSESRRHQLVLSALRMQAGSHPALHALPADKLTLSTRCSPSPVQIAPMQLFDSASVLPAYSPTVCMRVPAHACSQPYSNHQATSC